MTNHARYFCASVLMLFGTHAIAAVDQKQVVVSGFKADASGGRPVAQTFVAGASGELTQVDLILRPGFICTADVPLTVAIYDLNNNVPNVSLASETFAPPAIVGDAFVELNVNFTTPASVNAGTSYAIVISHSDNDACPLLPGFHASYGFTVGPQGVDTYLPGTEMFNNSISWVVQNTDLYFRTHIGETTSARDCPATPATTCVEHSGPANLVIARGTSQEKMSARFTRGQVADAVLGNPRDAFNADYAVCLYSNTTLVGEWYAGSGDTGFKNSMENKVSFSSKTNLSGLTSLRGRAGIDKGSFTITTKTAPVLPLSNTTTLQVLNTNACWSQSFLPEHVKTNTVTKFQASDKAVTP